MIKPKALFLIGPPASGKSTLLNEMQLYTYSVINVDNEYERLLKQEGIGMDIGNMSLEHLTKTGEIMHTARELTKIKEKSILEQKANIVFDTTGGSYKNIKNKKQELEELGYNVNVIAIYVSPYISLQRNNDRERKLASNAVIRSWASVVENYPKYELLFKGKICFVDSDPETGHVAYWNDPDLFMHEFPSPVGKKKTAEEEAKSTSKRIQTNNSIRKSTIMASNRASAWKSLGLMDFIIKNLI